MSREENSLSCSFDSLNEKIIAFEEEYTALKLRVDEMDNYSRMDNLIIHGFPESSCAETSTGLIRLSTFIHTVKLGVTQFKVFSISATIACAWRFDDSDILIAHRILRGKK